MSVEDKDKGYQALFARLDNFKAQKLGLTVGVHGPEASAVHEEPESPEPKKGAKPKAPITVGDIATVAEYGLGNNPKRSWLRDWVDQNQGEISGILKQVAEGAIQGRYSPSTAFDRAGLLFVAKIQERIRGNIPPALKDATVKRKGSSVALINTGQFVSAIRHQVTGKK